MLCICVRTLYQPEAMSDSAMSVPELSWGCEDWTWQVNSEECCFLEALVMEQWWAGLARGLRSFAQFPEIQWHPTPVLWPGESHGWRSLVGCRPWGRWELDTTERLHLHFSLLCTGEGNGNPLQCSCLENPRDGGAWWAAIYEVAQSQTQLKQLSSSSRDSKRGRKGSRKQSPGRGGRVFMVRETWGWTSPCIPAGLPSTP